MPTAPRRGHAAAALAPRAALFPCREALARLEGNMLVACWSVKGGSGTTVVAAAIALLAGLRSAAPVRLVDLAGDLPAALGLPSPGAPGLSEWLAAGDEVPLDALHRLEQVAGQNLRLLPLGDAAVVPPGPAEAPVAEHDAERLVAALTAPGEEADAPVVVDAGRIDRDPLAAAVVTHATTSLLVLRPCYLGLRRAASAPLRPTGVVLVDEPARALGARDIEDALGVPVVSTVPERPEIARAVDAGLLAGRLPRSLAAALRGAA